MVSSTKIGSDNDILRSRLKGYISRPMPKVSKRSVESFNPKLIRDFGETMPRKFVYHTELKPEVQAEPDIANHSMSLPQLSGEGVLCQDTSLLDKLKPGIDRINNATTSLKAVVGKVNKNYAIGIVAVILVATGVLLGINGFKANRAIETQIKAMNAVSENSVNAAASDDNLVATNNNNSVIPSIPSFLRIPILGVDAKVINVSTDSNNVIQAPGGIFDVGWYDGSAKLGEKGAVFMDGHVSGWTEHGVFYDIKNLKEGDEISAEGNDGQVFTYKVVALEYFDADNVDMSKALKPYISGKQGLNIMTCGGKFNNEQQKYEQRVVVYSILQ